MLFLSQMFVQKAYIITTKAQKFQILDDWQNYV